MDFQEDITAVEKRLKQLTKDELIHQILVGRKLLFNNNERIIRYRQSLIELKSKVYKSQDWNSVKELLNNITLL